jgi:hypothetical protein
MHRSSKISRACAALALAIALAGCNGKSDPTKENFTQAVQKHLDSIDAVCVTSGPVPFDLPHFEGYAEKQADALVKVGLLSKEPTRVKEGGQMIPGYHYSATDEGKKASRPGNEMCGGKAQLQSITWASSAEKPEVGATVEVKYIAKLIERPRWDDEAALRPTHIEVLSTDDGAYNAENFLVLTKDGWAVTPAVGTR